MKKARATSGLTYLFQVQEQINEFAELLKKLPNVQREPFKRIG